MSVERQAEVYDTYIFVGRRQPFTIVRVNTRFESAIAVRAYMEQIARRNATTETTYQPKEAYQFFDDLKMYLKYGHCAEGDDSGERLEVLRDLIPSRAEWKREFRGLWTPMTLDWPSANIFLLSRYK